MGKTSRSGSGMNILDHISESLETIFEVKILQSFDADADPGIFLNLDPGSWIRMEKFGSGINIPDPQYWYLERFISDLNSDPDTGPTKTIKLKGSDLFSRESPKFDQIWIHNTTPGVGIAT
jgi:hypothetical protein